MGHAYLVNDSSLQNIRINCFIFQIDKAPLFRRLKPRPKSTDIPLQGITRNLATFIFPPCFQMHFFKINSTHFYELGRERVR